MISTYDYTRLQMNKEFLARHIDTKWDLVLSMTSVYKETQVLNMLLHGAQMYNESKQHQVHGMDIVTKEYNQRSYARNKSMYKRNGKINT